MPYEGERAGYRPLERIVNSVQVRELLARSKTWRQEDPNYPVMLENAPEPSGELSDHIIAFDSSWQETPAGALQKDIYPSAQIGYITLSTVLLKTEELKKVSRSRPVDPVKYRLTRDETTLPAALPCANVITGDNPDARTSFRNEFYKMLHTVSESSDSISSEESLLTTYEYLLNTHDSQTRCPYSNSDPYEDSTEPQPCERYFNIAPGSTVCPCPKQLPIWSTDAARIHERFREDGTNGQQLGEVAQIWERLELLRYLHLIEDNENLLSQAHRIAFVCDGQLSVFGAPSWISQALKFEIRRINKKVVSRTGNDIIILGVEKTGRFVDHFELIDKTNEPGVARFNPRQLFMPNNRYITSRIANNETDKFYGSLTHFGRKFFYKAANQYRLVVTTAFVREEQEDLSNDDASLYPSLGKICALLDSVTSSQSPNSLMPIRLAHHAAAIPIRPSVNVLQNLAEGLMRNE